MSLKARLQEDMKVAMKARESDRLGTIRMLLAAVKQKEIDGGEALDDAAVVAVVDKMIKQRRDAAEQFTQGGRPELAAKERSEVDVLAQYMPQALSDGEVDSAIDAAVLAVGAVGPQDMGKVMGRLKGELAGRADLTQVSARVKARLSGAA